MAMWFILSSQEDADHIVNKTYMTRVEGENTRLRHYLARLHRKTLCYSCITRNVRIICEAGCLLPKT